LSDDDNDDNLTDEKAALLAAMANEKRLRILIALSNGETSVGDLAEYVEHFRRRRARITACSVSNNPRLRQALRLHSPFSSRS